MSEESQCVGKGGGYKAEYAAALNTQLMNAGDTLQPVLVLAWHGMEMNITDREHMMTWAERRGAIVLNIEKFSFQGELERRGKGRDRLAGAFLRLDIPALIQEHGLFDLPNICQPEVLYTDSDVFFMSRISSQDMLYVKQAVSNSEDVIVAYGAEAIYDAEIIHNSGVMIMHVDRFRAEWPKILQWGMEQPNFPAHDQLLLNGYFEQEGAGLGRKRASLPLLWNWKTYWPLAENVWPAVKVLHTHGPKPRTGLWRLASCKTDLTKIREGYHVLMDRGLCCNRGIVAAKLRDMVESIMKYETVCG